MGFSPDSYSYNISRLSVGKKVKGGMRRRNGDSLSPVTWTHIRVTLTEDLRRGQALRGSMASSRAIHPLTLKVHVLLPT